MSDYIPASLGFTVDDILAADLYVTRDETDQGVFSVLRYETAQNGEPMWDYTSKTELTRDEAERAAIDLHTAESDPCAWYEIVQVEP